MNKTICTLLLDERDNYTYTNGKLPIRPLWDKDLLKTFIKNETLSKEGHTMLPPSLKEGASITHSKEPYPITVPEIDAIADILIITRGKSRGVDGRKFRLTKFERILSTQGLEIWRRK